MIKVRSPGFAALAQRLAAYARTLAQARAENALRARHKDPWRWRDARLLWPDTLKER